MAMRNKIIKHYSNKIMDYRDLKQYVEHLVKGGAQLVYQAHLSAKDKVRVPPLLAEIERLKAQLAAQRGEESKAGKEALRLYWENCALQPYKAHVEGITRQWVLRSEHEALQKRFDEFKRLDEISYQSHRAMEQEWAEFVNKYDDSSAPVLIKEIKKGKSA